MQGLVSRHRARLQVEFFALEAFVSEMDAAIADLVETTRRNLTAEGSEQRPTAAKVDHMLATTFANRLGYGAIVAVYATVEHSLVTLCDLARRIRCSLFTTFVASAWSGSAPICTVRSGSRRNRSPPGRT
jgi:hypothetical protein